MSRVSATLSGGSIRPIRLVHETGCNMALLDASEARDLAAQILAACDEAVKAEQPKERLPMRFDVAHVKYGEFEGVGLTLAPDGVGETRYHLSLPESLELNAKLSLAIEKATTAAKEAAIHWLDTSTAETVVYPDGYRRRIVRVPGGQRRVNVDETKRDCMIGEERPWIAYLNEEEGFVHGWDLETALAANRAVPYLSPRCGDRVRSSKLKGAWTVQQHVHSTPAGRVPVTDRNGAMTWQDEADLTVVDPMPREG